MRRCLPVLLAVLVLVAGCGQGSGSGAADRPADQASRSGVAVPSPPSSEPPPPPTPTEVIPGCAAGARTVASAKVVAELDLDGDGAPEQVAWTGSGASSPGVERPCANALVATVDGRTTGVPLDRGQAGLEDAEVVDLGDRQLLLVRGPAHPRGGYAVHLYGLGPDGLGEVVSEGHPLLGFVATDGGAAPATAVCAGDGGIGILRASTSGPAGGRPAWDVRRTTYALHGNRAVRQSSRTVVDDAADGRLRRRMPQLFETGAYFRDCAHPAGTS